MTNVKEKFLKDIEVLREKRVIVKDKEIADNTEFSTSVISNYLSGRVVPSKNFIEKFYSHYGKYLEEKNVFKSTGEAAGNQVIGATILHVPVEAEAGFLGGDINPVYNYDLKQWTLPGFDEPGFSFPIRGDSMFPTFKEGEIVVTGVKVEPYDHIRREYVYVIVNSESILIKRLNKKGDGVLQLISDNTKFPTTEMNYDEVKIYRARRNVSWDLSKKYSK